MLSQLVSEYSRHLQDEKGIAQATLRSYLAAVASMLEVCRDYPRRLHLPPQWTPRDLDKRALEIYLNHLREERGWRPSTLAQQASALRSFFNFLQSRGHIERNPMRNLLPKQPPRDETPPDGDEAAVLAMFEAPLETPPTGLRNARLQLALELGYGGGLKPSQIYGVRSLRIAPRAGLVRVVTADASLEVPLGADGLERARIYLDLRREAVGKRRGAAFWVDEQGRPCSAARLGKQIKLAMERVGLPGRPMLLRQLAARHFAERGGDIRSLQRLLHAKRLGALDRYAPPDYRQVLEQFRRIHPRQQERP